MRTELSTFELSKDNDIKCYSLSSCGVESVAFSENEVFEMLNILRKNAIPILGGDVYILKDNIIDIDYANWYCERMPNETMREFANRSFAETDKFVRDYLEKFHYNHKSDDDLALFDLVIDCL